jgi:hypothetical protein
MSLLKFAQDAVLYVRRVKCIHQTNLPPRAEIVKTAYQADEEAFDAIDTNIVWRVTTRARDIVGDALLAKDRGLFEKYSNMKWMNNPMTIGGNALAAVTAHIGNCDAQASVAFDYLARQRAKLDLKFLLEMWQAGGGDGGDSHVFTVLGREPEKEVDNCKAWNPAAVVCDPWAGEAYLATELYGKMTDKTYPMYTYTKGKPWLQLLFQLAPKDDWPWTDEPDAPGATLPTW